MRFDNQLVYRREVMELLRHCRVTDNGHLIRFELDNRYAVFNVQECMLDYYCNNEKLTTFQCGRIFLLFAVRQTLLENFLS